MVYVDNSATSRKKPFSVYLAMLSETFLSANAGRGGHKAGIRTARRIEETRELIRNYFFDGNVVFTKNCTEALNLAIMRTELKGKIITTICEHNSVLRPLYELKRRNSVEVKTVEPDDKGKYADKIKNAVDANTSAVIISGMSNVTGAINDVESVAYETKMKNKNAIVIVDMAQAAGRVAFDYTNIDVICCSGHKELHGLEGTGFLIAKRNVKILPLLYGGTGTLSASPDMPKSIPDALEAGTQNAPGIIALSSGIKYTFRNMKKLNSRIDGYCDWLGKRLSRIKRIDVIACANGILLCNVKGLESGEVGDILSAKYGIYTRGGLHCAPLMHKYLGTFPQGAVRISFGKNNTFFSVLYIYWALKRIAESD